MVDQWSPGLEASQGLRQPVARRKTCDLIYRSIALPRAVSTSPTLGLLQMAKLSGSLFTLSFFFAIAANILVLCGLSGLQVRRPTLLALKRRSCAPTKRREVAYEREGGVCHFLQAVTGMLHMPLRRTSAIMTAPSRPRQIPAARHTGLSGEWRFCTPPPCISGSSSCRMHLVRPWECVTSD
jgi:hypothetical protein